tara:strand:- start:362 stop:502 length:141 start_codon:yes stop_codon:yes gene_type:complete
LEEDEFECLFGITREEFAQMPKWMQVSIFILLLLLLLLVIDIVVES